MGRMQRMKLGALLVICTPKLFCPLANSSLFTAGDYYISMA